MDKDLNLDILLALDAADNRITKLDEIRKKYGENAYFSALEQLRNEGYITYFGVEHATDRSRMYSILITTKPTAKGVQYIKEFSGHK